MVGPRGSIACLVALLGLAACAGTPDTSSRAWPVANREGSAAGLEHTDVLWPIWQELSSPGRKETRVRPLYRRIEGKDEDLLEIAWPVFTVRSQPGRTSVLLLPVFYDRRLFEESGWNDRDWAVIPVLFGGSDPMEGDYFLFFPFWGNLRGLFGKDEIEVRLFPFYLETRQGEYRSWHALWPIVSGGEGEGKRDFRILPFWSHREKEGVSRSTSVLWPFVSFGEEALDTAHPVKSTLVFPFYGDTSSDVAWSRLFLFPAYMASGADGGYLDLNVLWPIFRSRTGPDGSQSLRVWPLFSRTREGANRADFYLWPIFWDSSQETEGGRFGSFQFVPFVRSAVRTDPEGKVLDRDLQLWPLVRRREGGDGTVRFTALAPIPLVNLESFEAAWGWSWSLLDHVSGPGGVSTDLLFGLFQHRRSAEGAYAGVPLLLEYASKGAERKTHLLKGLIGYESSEEGPALRLFWFLRIGL